MRVIAERSTRHKKGQKMAKTKTKTPTNQRKKKLRKVTSLRDEQWALINGTEDFYISNLGRLKRITSTGENLRKDYVDSEGYRRVRVGTRKYRLHRLVAEYFVPNPNNLPVVDHLDADKSNCRWDNLEWVTQEENTRRAAEMGLHYFGASTLALVIDQENKGYLFDNVITASKNLDLPLRASYKVASGKQNTTRGYKIIRLKDFEDRREKINE